MYGNIVVGYDGTDEARDALALASVLRARSGMVTAACMPAEPGTAGAKRTLAPIGERTDSPSWLRTLQLAGGSEHLLRLVHDTGADLLVLGSSGRGELGRTLTGPVGRRLLFGCHCPVAVAPRGFREVAAKPRTVTIAFGGEDEAASAVDGGSAPRAVTRRGREPAMSRPAYARLGARRRSRRGLQPGPGRAPPPRCVRPCAAGGDGPGPS